MSSLGIDIGGGSVKAALLLRDGSSAVAASNKYTRPDPAQIQCAIQDAVEQLGAFDAAPDSLSLCLPGVLGDAGKRVEYAANLPGLVGATIESLLPEPLRSIPRCIVPDALAAGVGAWISEPVSGRLLVLTMGTGVGAALLDNGRPLTTASAGIGHVGQIDVSLDAHAPIAPDAGRGSLEAYVGLPALRARFGDSHASAIASLDEHDPALRALARAIRICHAIATPAHIRIVGGVGAMFAPALPTLRTLIERDLTLVARERWSLACIDDLYLGARGCARLADQPSEA